MLTSIARGIRVYIYNELYDLESRTLRRIVAQTSGRHFLRRRLERDGSCRIPERQHKQTFALLTQNVTVRQSNLHMTLYASRFLSYREAQSESAGAFSP